MRQSPSGNTELSSDYTESGIAIETAPDGARYYKLSGTVGTEADTLAFIAFYDISSVFAMRDGQFKTYAAVFAVTIAVCAVLSYFISLWLTKPLDKLTKATKKLAEGELSYRADIRTGDEIGQLSESFDAMAQKLEENVEQLQDAMHRQEEFMGSFALAAVFGLFRQEGNSGVCKIPRARAAAGAHGSARGLLL